MLRRQGQSNDDAFSDAEALSALRQADELAADESTKGSERYVCSDCDDPMRNPLTRNWVDGPLRPPEE